MLDRALLLLFVTCGLCVGAPWAATAQEVEVASPVLTLDQERLFQGSGLSQRVSEEIDRLSQELAEENARIEAELVAEELALTEQRPTLDPDAFRDLADAFDQKVQALRAEQDAKLLRLQQLRDEEQQMFLRQITPVLTAIVRERGAVIVLDRRAVVLSADAIDITEEAIRRVNAALDARQEAPAEP